MRILLLSDAQSTHTRRWAKGLSDRGTDLHVMSLRPGDIEGVTVYPLKPIGGVKALYPSVIPRLRGLIRRLQPDIVHAHYATSYGLLAALSGHPRVVISAWGTDVLIAPRESVLLRALLRFSLRRAQAVTSMAEHMNAPLLALGVSPERLHAFPHGIEVARFVARAAADKQPGSVVCTRGFHSVYDVECLVRAFAEARSSGYLQRLTLLGDGPLRAHLQSLVHLLGIENWVSFLGQVDRDALPAILGTQEVYVSPSSSDGNSVSLNEAMAAGCFPVVTAIAANTQWISHGVNGLLYPPGDAHALATLLRSVPGQSRLLDEARHLNLERVKRDADWQTTLDRMYAIYEQIRA